MLLDKSGEITPEGMKRLSKSRNSTQSWMCRVMEVKSDAVKSNVTYEPECEVHESRQFGSGQTGDGKSGKLVYMV